MRKLSLLFILTFLVSITTGCGSSKIVMTCTTNQNSTGVDINIKEAITFKNNRIIDATVTTTSTFENAEAAEIFTEKYQSTEGAEVKKDGNVVTVIEKDDIPNNEVVAEELKQTYEEDGWTCSISK